MTLPRERVAYSAIVDRPRLKLPAGKRIIVWTIVNLEVWDISRPMARQVLPPPTGASLLPDVPNWSWHEYGMRVGFWRFHALYRRLKIRPTLAINARVCVDYPRVAQACLDAGWEFMGHSYEQGPIHNEKDQPAMIKRSLDTLEKFTGRRPVGWLGPGLTETYDTPEHLTAAGIRYIGDWVYDDEPTVIRTAVGPLLTLPYTVELNDIPMMIIQHHESDYLLRRATDQFDRLYAEGEQRAKIFALAIHPYISGQPHRIKYLEAIYDYARRFDGVVYWTGEEILHWYLQSGAVIREKTWPPATYADIASSDRNSEGKASWENTERRLRRCCSQAHWQRMPQRLHRAEPVEATMPGWPPSNARPWRKAFPKPPSPPPGHTSPTTSTSSISIAVSAFSPRPFWNSPAAWLPPTASSAGRR